MLTNSYFTKSFFMLGQSLNGCFKCLYCRLIGKDSVSYESLPSEINSQFRKLPVAVNLFYGDPMLQINKTIEILKRLEEDKHTGPVIIVTKGDFSKFPDIHFNLDLHIAFSTFGVDSKYDGGSLKQFKSNLEQINKRKHNYNYSIEYRPVIHKVNDYPFIIENVFICAYKYKLPIAFCGLQVTPELKEYFTKNGINFEQYEGYEFGLKKAVSKEVEDTFYRLSEKYEIPVFRKTSCLISYSSNLDRDYNAHYYRPNEMRCAKCPMHDKCYSHKLRNDNSSITNIDIPFEYELVNKTNHTCYLFKQGICKFASNDCKNITGNILKIKERLTSSDVRVIKWLTGYTVECEFDELPYISKKWKQDLKK